MKNETMTIAAKWPLPASRVARFILAAFFLSAPALLVADPIYDDASDPVYAGGDYHGLNGGAGLGPWQNNPSENDDNAGTFIGDSNGNGGGAGPGINSGDGVSFGLYANSGAMAEAYRVFGGPLLDNQILTIDFDNGWIDGENSSQGFALLDAGGTTRFEFFFRAGSDFYSINDSEEDATTGIPFTDGGLNIAIAVTSADSYTITIVALASGNITVLSDRIFGGDEGEFVEVLRVFNYNEFEGGSERDLFVNYLEIRDVEEAACSVILVEGAVPSCPGTMSSFTGPDGADSYAWSIENNSSGGTIVGLDNQSVVIVGSGAEVGSFDLVLQVSVGGSVSECVLTVPVQGPPTPEAGSNSPICEGEDLILMATEIPGATYTWVGPDLFLSSEQNPVIIEASRAAAGEYSVSASQNGCPSGVSSTMVVINAIPECLISGDDDICPGVEEVVYYAPNDLISYTWTLEGNASMINDPFSGTLRIIPEASGSFTLTLVVEDNNGCSVTCVKNVNIGDGTPPELVCPEDVVLAPGSDTSPDATGEASAADACDANPVISYTDELIAGDCIGSFVILRTWTAADQYGNSDSCVQTIIVQDDEPPVLSVPPEAYLTCGADTSPEVLGFAVATDNTDENPSISYIDTVYTIDCDYYLIIERLWIAEDACGNIAEEFQIITVEDAEAPTLVVPADATIALEDDTDPETLGYAVATDQCDPDPSVGYYDDIVESGCPSQYTIRRIWFAEDACGNTTEAIQTITVGGGDVTMTTPADTVIECDADTSPEALGVAVATDSLGEDVPVDYADEVIPGDCEGRYIIQRIWFAEDACGNGVEAIQTIVVDDRTAPVLAIPADAVVACGGDVSVSALGEATASDACDGEPVVSHSDEVADVLCGSSYTILRTWRAADQCGNIALATQNILVVDDQAPELVVPDDAAVACGDDTSPASLGSAMASDNCEPELSVTYSDNIIDGACAGSYLIERTWRAADGCGNASEGIQVITVTDATAPAVAAPADINVGCGSSIDPSVTGEATVSGDCSEPVVLTYEDDVVDGVIVRTWIAVDACGNRGEAAQIIGALPDETAPVLEMPADVEAGCFDDLRPEALGIATASDDCDPAPVVTYDDTVVPGECAGQYIIERRWMAVDVVGNGAEAVQLISVTDAAAPILVAPADVSVGCGESTEPAHTGMATATDGCSGVASLVYSDEVDGATILRTWTAVDGCGNAVSAAQTIVTSGGGNGPPVITSPGDQVVVVVCGQPVVFEEPTAVSDCDPAVSVVCVPPSGSALGAGTHLITCTASDAAGNTSTATFQVTVLSPLRVVFQSPLKDDNLANDIETDADVVNLFKSGSTLPHKVKLFDCSGKDVTRAVAPLVNVRLDVTLRINLQPSVSTKLLDMWMLYSGLGGPNGQMVFQGNQFHYNLRTLLYPPNTVNKPWFFRSHVTVAYKAAPGIVVGSEDALLESRK